jgi:hypothetical protein
VATGNHVCSLLNRTSVSTPQYLYQSLVGLERTSVSRRLSFHPRLSSPTYANDQLAFSLLYLYAILPRHCPCRWCGSTLSQSTARSSPIRTLRTKLELTDKCARSIRLHATSAGKSISSMSNSVNYFVRHYLYVRKASYFSGT